MLISNKEPIKVLWDLFKPLHKEKIAIYKEIMHEEENDIPNSYILLRSSVTDTINIVGDGNCLIRTADCDVILVTKGYAEDTNDLHNVNRRKIEKLLKDNEINYSFFNLGYDASLKSTQCTFSFEVNYGS